MLVKEARPTMRALIKAAQAERLENIKTAFANGRTADLAQLKPYRNDAFLALIRGTGDLVALVSDQPE
jgi:hypothetical protein